MNHTIEDSKGRQIVCTGVYEKEYEEKNRKGYKIQEGNYNKRNVKEVDVLNIQEFKVHDGLTDDKEILEQIKKNFEERLTDHAIKLRAQRGMGKE